MVWVEDGVGGWCLVASAVTSTCAALFGGAGARLGRGPARHDGSTPLECQRPTQSMHVLFALSTCRISRYCLLGGAGECKPLAVRRLSHSYALTMPGPTVWFLQPLCSKSQGASGGKRSLSKLRCRQSVACRFLDDRQQTRCWQRDRADAAAKASKPT